MIENRYEGKERWDLLYRMEYYSEDLQREYDRKLLRKIFLRQLIGLPGNLFFGTGIPAAILIFNKGEGKKKTCCLLIRASSLKRGKTKNHLREEDINRIVEHIGY